MTAPDLELKERFIDLNDRKLPPGEKQAGEKVAVSLALMAVFYGRYVRGMLLHLQAHQSLRPDRIAVKPETAGTRLKPDWGRIAKYAEWMNIALRDGALASNHFGQSLFRVNNHARKSKTIAALLDRKKLGQAVKTFTDAFPSIGDVRDLVGHEWEIDEKRNRFTGDIGGIKNGKNNIYCNYEFGKIVGAINGRAVEFGFSRENLEALTVCRNLTVESFATLGELVSTHERSF